MCGIAGFVDRGDRGVEWRSDLIDRMCRVISHRGPDDQGVMVDGEVALGMRRLSIIDLAGGHQPISTEDGALTIVFNGEIYNYRELRADLEKRGCRFRTDCDTEVILQAFAKLGPACLDLLRGMFAFAVWDARDRSLFVARDRVGKKPLYYTTTPAGAFVFGSELKSVLEHPDVRRDVSAEAVDAYLTFGYVPDPLTIFGDVHKLPPGHYLTLAGGRPSVRQYWDVVLEPAEPRSEEEYLEELNALLDEAVRIRLVADVPLGAFLSGGIDSSTVVGLMARHSDRPVKTFSIGFHEDSYDELKYARVAAAHFGTDHHEFVVTPKICDIVDELVWHYDEPFADPSSLPTYMVSKMAREHVTVVLTGDGGDEVFAGYTRYVIDRKRSAFGRVPGPVRRGVMRPFARRLPHGAWGRNYLHNVSLDPLDRYVENLAIFTSLSKDSLYTGDFRARLGGADPARRFLAYAANARTGDPVDRLLAIDSKTYLPGDILTKVDRMSMAVSLEARAPLLDHKLIEFAARIPASLKLKGTETKHIFKRAVRSFVPGEILDRPKQGFGLPIQQWINNELRDQIRDTITDAVARGRGYVEPAYVDVLLEEHERNRRDHSWRLWALFMLESWHRTFADGGPRSPRGESVVMLEGVR
jgi:asparagine synthase (glutamine-hydrolysing)